MILRSLGSVLGGFRLVGDFGTFLTHLFSLHLIVIYRIFKSGFCFSLFLVEHFC